MARHGSRRSGVSHGSRTVLLALVVLAGAAWSAVGRCWAGPLAGRRALLAGFAAGGSLVAGSEAHAFANAVYQYDRAINDAKKPGPQPRDLGLLQRDYLTQSLNSLNKEDAEKVVQDGGILKECTAPPNCFSTTYTEYVDTGLHDINPWRFSGKTPDQAMQDVADVVQAYEPGQQGIDGGGFAVKGKEDSYLYVIYESLKRGHRDDVEFAVIPGTPKDAKEGGLYVRSSSRQGGFDYGVNAIRLNKLAEELMKKGGWKIEMINAKNHERYWSQNCQAGDRRKAPFVVRKKFPQMCKDFPENA